MIKKGEAFWQKYCEEENIDINLPHDIWKYGGTGDELAYLTLSGKKTGTASPHDCYAYENTRIPFAGLYSVICLDNDEPICIVKNVNVLIKPFKQCPHFHAYTEGEDDRSLKKWREVHSKVFLDDYKSMNIEFNEDSKLVLEEFVKVYPQDEDELYLMLPNDSYLQQYEEFKSEVLKEDGKLEGCGRLGNFDDLSDWIKDSDKLRNPEIKFSEDYVQTTELVAVRKSDDKVIGTIRLRHYLNPYLEKYRGHIGYCVRPSERELKYGKWMLKSILPYAKSLELKSLIITCREDNIPSQKTILSLNGKYLNTIKDLDSQNNYQRYEISL